MKKRIFFILISLISLTAYAAKPAIFLLKNYHQDIPVTGWLMSEKLDGVRGYWDGNKLISRGGKILSPPAWFTQNYPPFPIDGELWTQRADFENISSIVNSQEAGERWKQITHQIFDVPNQTGNLHKRLQVLQNYLDKNPTPYIQIIQQTTVNNKKQLQRFLHSITANQGEGVVVRDPNQAYQTGRLSSALKLKEYTDTECTVLKVLPGKGQYQGKMGSILCLTSQGKQLTIGSGFSNKDRTDPPLIGSQITFKYYGLTKKGRYRFPVYLRPFNKP
ncbi:DNA ligase [Cycloclasticus pugetii]|jgi:DNA ligase-1|uniref:DNA ligase n=1 Tax=Cycloclasticus pugetii TaxID=34068 RepID=UPI002409E05E|nr:DNA ligase [Cycloclasticus pugetii]MDF1830140.1 DNA ligase [Cycloclasticus pugetii]